MGEPYIGQIALVPYNFVPERWANCDGSLLPIMKNQALYSLLGNRFGGDGRTNFALPNLEAPAENLQYVIALQGIYPPRY